MTATFDTESACVDWGWQSWSFLSQAMGGSVFGEECAGLLGYEHGVRFFRRVAGESVLVGRVDWGGDHHAGRGRLDLTGTGCAAVRRWDLLADQIRALGGVRLTRVDIAVDFRNGEWSVDDVREWYGAGLFRVRGRPPRAREIRDPLGKHGDTFEVGRRENGKMLRVYEKGRQLGDCASPWVRFEVELRNEDRELPLDVFERAADYFAGAYAVLAELVESGSVERIATIRAEGEICIGRLLAAARTSYGKLVHVLRLELTDIEIVHALVREGVPRRLHKGALGFSEALAAA